MGSRTNGGRERRSTHLERKHLPSRFSFNIKYFLPSLSDNKHLNIFPQGCSGRYVGRGKWESDPTLCISCISTEDNQAIAPKQEEVSSLFSAASLFEEDEEIKFWKKGDCLAPTEGVLLGGDLPPDQGGGGLHVSI